MDKQTKNYRKAQFENTDIQENPYLRTLKITSTKGNTNCLDITQSEYEAIKTILTKGIK